MSAAVENHEKSSLKIGADHFAAIVETKRLIRSADVSPDVFAGENPPPEPRENC